MDSLPEQVTTLHLKIDAMHEVVEQLNNQTSEVLFALKTILDSRNPLFYSDSNSSKQAQYNRMMSDSGLEHKDVLIDAVYSDHDSQGSDRNFSPEIQIQRLTAQLTAAYNRIAALEEQLLSKRIH
jgi:hypothetical protein